ncbi:hypothetical protein [uncultured Bifidobacterium sp.]|uniref:hypothetical protein n=1 Tax=uncultured Bifidobacterium sp. TaxID=165187 RepID=UPI00259881CB|nr:hypothetical protein [uncultured Bifidobacterium sp.]
MGENLTNDALRLLWDVIRDADVALDNVTVDVYDRDTGTDGFYGFGDDMPEDDAVTLDVPYDELKAVVSLDADADYGLMPETATVDVELPAVDITYGDPDRTLKAVGRILDQDWMYDSANVRIYIYDQDSGRDAYFDYGETIVDSDVMELYDWAEDEDGDEDRFKVVTANGDVTVDYGDAEDALQRVVNLDDYELPGNMLVSVDLGRITVM